MKTWGQLKDLEMWLQKDQPLITRMRTSSNSSSSFSIENIDESEFAIAHEEDDLDDWLVSPSTAATETMSDVERWRQVFKPFEDSWSSSDWLVGSEPPNTDCSSCCQTTNALEIENLGQLKCLKTSPSPGPTSSEALEAWLQQVVPVQQNCRANDVCSSYADCVCDQNCGKDALNLWLLHQDGRDKNGVPVVNKCPPVATNAPPADKNVPQNLQHREKEQKVCDQSNMYAVFFWCFLSFSGWNFISALRLKPSWRRGSSQVAPRAKVASPFLIGCCQNRRRPVGRKAALSLLCSRPL